LTDILLTHSYHLFYDRKQARKMQPYPPLGTLYAAAVLTQNGFSVELFDSMLNDPDVEFLQAVARCRPNIVAIYEDSFNFLSKMCLTRMREAAFGMIDAARAYGSRVVVNGSDAADHCDAYLQHGADYVLLGEAEITLLELVRSLAGAPGDYAADIPGLAFLHSTTSKVIRTPPRPLLRDLDRLPLPARDLLDIARYKEAWRQSHGFFSLNLVASRGCPYRCNWCAKPIYGNSFHARSAESVAEEMRQLREDFGADHLCGINNRWVRSFAEQVVRRDARVPFKMQSRADLMSSETVADLKRAGCFEVWMGVESGSQKILDAMEKGTRVEQIVRARENLGRHDIRACYFLQFGYPGETWREIQETIQLIRETRPDDIGVSVSYPLPGTAFHDRVRAELGRKTNWVDSEDLSMMFKGAYTSEFYRALHDALHAEVDSWRGRRNWKFDLRDTSQSAAQPGANDIRTAWAEVERLERTCRNDDATQLAVLAASTMECD